MSEFKAGDIVRYYPGGVTSLARLLEPHPAGCGWHAEHCLGGVIYFSNDWVRAATPDEIDRARQSSFWALG